MENNRKPVINILLHAHLQKQKRPQNQCWFQIKQKCFSSAPLFLKKALFVLPYTEVLSHLLSAGPHDGLVLSNTQLLAVHQAGAFGSRLVLVVGVLFQVLLAEASLLLIIGLLLQVGHGFPAGACRMSDTLVYSISISI